MWNKFYIPHRRADNPIHNDDIIYTPDVWVCKSDVDFPERLREEEWYQVDVITCKTISFRMPHMKKSIRGKSLGEKYDKDVLEKRIAEATALKEEELRAEQEVMREETLDVAEKQPLVKVPVEEFGADVLEETVAMEEAAVYVNESVKFSL